MISKKILDCIDLLCKKEKINSYVGIIAYGSMITGTNNESLDLDIMIIKSEYSEQDRGNTMINGIKVDYSIYDIDKLYAFIKKENQRNDPSHLTKFATCEIVYDSNSCVKRLVDYAIKLYNKKIAVAFGKEEQSAIVSINNRIQDLEALINDECFYAVYYIILEKIRVLYAKINGIISLPITKVEKLYTNSEYAKKYISSPVHKLPDQYFVDQYLICLKIYKKTTMLNNIKTLYVYSFSNLNFDPNNYRSKIEYFY